MPESLVITTRQNVLDVVDHLRGVEGLKIKVESDFTRGLKAIFYGLPKVVFIQDEIGEISGEKVAGQVKTLLENEPIRLVLLREQSGEWDSGDIAFDAVIDIGLPFDELLNRFLYALNSLPGSGMEPPAEAAPAGESPPESSFSDNNLEFDPFSDVFPAQFHPNWGPSPQETLQEPLTDARQFQETIELSTVEDDFCFEPPGDIITSIPIEEPKPPILTDIKDQKHGSPASAESPADATAMGRHGQVTDIRLAGRESPHQLFASMNDDEIGGIPPVQKAGEPSALSMGDRLRLKGVQTQSSLIKAVDSAENQASSLTQGLSKTPSAGGTAPTKTAKPPSLKSPQRSLLSADSRGGQALRENQYVDQGPAAGKSIARKVMPVLLLALIAFTTFMLVQHWDYLTGLFNGSAVTVSTPPLTPPPVVRSLPAFFPKVPPESRYAVTHPGWELYHDRGLDFLAFRGQGRLLAVQVIAGKEGKISESFLRMCIRETTGLANGENWVSRKRDDFLVENGKLRDRGEVAVYRKMPEGEIRGFVLTFR